MARKKTHVRRPERYRRVDTSGRDPLLRRILEFLEANDGLAMDDAGDRMTMAEGLWDFINDLDPEPADEMRQRELEEEMPKRYEK
jgi:hypothetical protein